MDQVRDIAGGTEDTEVVRIPASSARRREPATAGRTARRGRSSPSSRPRSSSSRSSGCCSARRGAACGTTSPRPQARDAIRLSLVCSLWSTALCVVFGVPLAWVLARTRVPGTSLVRALVVLPMVLPPVVGGVALLFTFQRNGGLLGEWLYDWFGHPAHVQHVGRGARRDVRRDAVPRDHGRGRAPHDGPALRGRRRQPRRRTGGRCSGA